MYTPTSSRFVFLGLFSAFLVLATFLTACTSSEADGNGDSAVPAGSFTRVTPVEAEVIELQTFNDVVNVSGAVASLNNVVVSAQSSGTLEYSASVGTSVSRGSLVGRVNATLLESALDQAKASLAAAEAQLNLAQDAYNRQEPLYADSIISALEFEGVRTQLAATKAGRDQAQAVVTQAEKQIRNTRIVAPFAGVIEQRLAEPGSQVMPGTPIAQIVSTARVKIIAGVSERFAADIKRGATVDIAFPAFGGEVRTGVISFVGNVVNPNSRTFTIEIELNNSDGMLKPQMTAEISIVRSRMENVLTVPQSAIMRDENGTSVYAIEMKEGKPTATRKAVVAGPSQSGRTVIRSGLQPGDQVVVVGQSNVTEGDVLDILK